MDWQGLTVESEPKSGRGIKLCEGGNLELRAFDYTRQIQMKKYGKIQWAPLAL